MLSVGLIIVGGSFLEAPEKADRYPGVVASACALGSHGRRFCACHWTSLHGHRSKYLPQDRVRDWRIAMIGSSGWVGAGKRPARWGLGAFTELANM